MNNEFSKDTRLLFIYTWECFYCGSNKADAIHHIVGRGAKESCLESSPLNAAPICNHKCHIPNHGLLKTEEQMKILLNKTYKFLIESGYILTEKDLDFIEKYSNFYY